MTSLISIFEKLFRFSLVKIQRRIYEANQALKYFVLHNWIFKNKNFETLSYEVKLEDEHAFSFHEAFNFDIILYIRYALTGLKKYLLGDKDENIPRNQVVFRRLKLLDRFVKAIPYAVAFYYIFIKYDLVNVCKNYLIN